MTAILKGLVKSSPRVVSGSYSDGKRKGEAWEFLSLEITDTTHGFVWACQMSSDDPGYSDLVKSSDATAALAGHKVKVTIKAQTAGPRELKDGRKIMQIRSQITNLLDLGVPSDDDE